MDKQLKTMEIVEMQLLFLYAVTLFYINNNVKSILKPIQMNIWNMTGVNKRVLEFI